MPTEPRWHAAPTEPGLYVVYDADAKPLGYDSVPWAYDLVRVEAEDIGDLDEGLEFFGPIPRRDDDG